jgi:hypothetical protein
MPTHDILSAGTSASTPLHLVDQSESRLHNPLGLLVHGGSSVSEFEQLSELGFAPAAKLTWSEDDIEFRFFDWTSHADDKAVLYAYTDAVGMRLLYIGQTSGSFRARSSGYKRWLNGRDKNKNAPVNGAWLNCLLGECTPSKVYVWTKVSSVDEAARRAEERELIIRLRPVLNTKA